MGWDLPVIWVEASRETRDSRYFSAVLRADEFFWARRWKAFLMGHQKYGRKPSWDPVKPLRGLPDDLSEPVKLHSEKWKDRGLKDATYYSLRELEEIDLDEHMGTPEAGHREEGVDDYGYGVEFEIRGSGFQRTVEANSLKESKIQEALKKGQTSIKAVRTEEDKIFPRKEWNHIIQNVEGWSEDDKIEEMEAELHINVFKRSDYAEGFEDFIDLLNEIREDGRFGKLKTLNQEAIPKEDIRIVIWV